MHSYLIRKNEGEAAFFKLLFDTSLKNLKSETCGWTTSPFSKEELNHEDNWHNTNVKTLAFTTSYKKEIAATEFTLSWISTNTNSAHTSILMCTNKQLLFGALSSSNARINFICQSISQFHKPSSFNGC